MTYERALELVRRANDEGRAHFADPHLWAKWYVEYVNSGQRDRDSSRHWVGARSNDPDTRNRSNGGWGG